MDQYDVVVAGAGPAGALSALLLARQRPELRILLLEATVAAVAKPCGEYLAPAGVAVLRDAGLDRVLAGGRPLRSCWLVGGGERVVAPRAGVGIRREELDGGLQAAAVAAGCALGRGRRLDGAKFGSDGWRLRVGGDEVRAALLVGADGRQSMVRRGAGLDLPLRRRRFALTARARGIAHGEAVEMHLGALGQIGLAPLGAGEVNLNLLLAPRSTPLLRLMPPARLLALALAATPGLRARARGAELDAVHATGSLPRRARAVVGDGVALVGDAAGFCDPVSGEGMSHALLGARALATTLAGLDVARPPPTRDLVPYASAWWALVGRRHRLAGCLQALLDRRPWAEAAVRLAARTEPLGRALLATPGG